MDRSGYFNFGNAISFQKAICDVAKKVVVEVNQSQPWVYGGYGEAIHIGDIDYIVENNEYEIDEVITPPPSETDRRIAENAVGLVEDEATIELGVGVIPDLVGELLIDYGLKDLGIHTGTLTDSMVDLIEAGVATGRKKSVNPGKAVHCMGLGSRRLYEYMGRNRGLAGFSCDYTHDVQVIALHKKYTAINSALKIDLTGQVCSESAGHRQISGTGGQLQYTRGANMSPGGKAIICLPSTRRDRQGKALSNIALDLEPGDTVTVPASEAGYIVTEFGTVNLRGKSTWQRAKLLVSIAHPDFRDELEDAARRNGLITPGTAKLG
jgi:acyl-CoA hydrolase